MIIYFSAPKKHELTILQEEGVTHALFSYIDPDFNVIEKALDMGFKVMIDSGAYTAFTQNIKIDINEYAAVLKEYGDFAEAYINLDDCKCPIQTQKNQNYLEDKGLVPVPVYHFGEDPKILHNMAQQYDYIGIGSSVLSAIRPKKKFYQFSNQITKKYKNKFHGFAVGMLKPELMGYYSVDSTTWLSGAKFGKQIGKFKIVQGQNAGLFWTREELLRHNIRALLWQKDNIKKCNYYQEEISLDIVR